MEKQLYKIASDRVLRYKLYTEEELEEVKKNPSAFDRFPYNGDYYFGDFYG